VRIAVDVQNRLLGPEGATAVYGPQKGLLDWQAPAMEAALSTWATRLQEDIGADVTSIPGAGAGGGIPAGVIAWQPAATIESGAALVSEAIELAARIASADLVVTGEGAFDGQTAYGKAVAHVVATARDGRRALPRRRRQRAR
jgi:glycerate 2-kinase